MPARLRVSVTLPGGAALGAYQAGAVAALLVAVQALADGDDPVVEVDAVGGASAGSLVAVVGAYCLVEGLDPVAVLHEAWVEQVSLEVLDGHGGRAPLSFEGLRRAVGTVFDPRDPDGRPLHRVEVRQASPVGVHIALTGLQGLAYRVGGLHGRPVEGITYVDWAEVELRTGGGTAQVTEPEGRSALDLALASAANPAAFAPRLLDRRREADAYRAAGIVNFPASGHLWYTDGGLVQAEPLGRVLAAARRAEEAAGAPARRLHVLVDPRAVGPSGSTQWSDPDRSPSWVAGLARSLAVVPGQVLYEDLRRVEKDNSRLAWAGELAEALAPHLGEGAPEALRAVLARVVSDRAHARARQASDGEVDDEVGGMVDGTDSLQELLRRTVAAVAGVDHEHPVDVQVISPRLLATDVDDDVPELLAGEFLGDFGGFLSREVRTSDFALGYASAERWLERNLGRGGLDDREVRRAAEAVAERRLHDWREVNVGDARPRHLPWPARLRLARLAARYLRVVVTGAVDVGAVVPERVRRLGRGGRGGRGEAGGGHGGRRGEAGDGRRGAAAQPAGSASTAWPSDGVDASA